MHITVTGNLGSGKSTICRLLSEKYHFELYSTGKVQRELARKMNMTTLELNQFMCDHKQYDKMIDDETARISRENKDRDIIFDSRLAWHFVERSFKVFVSVSLEAAAERVIHDQRGTEEKYASMEEAKLLLAERASTEKERYKDIYGLNYMDFSNYNLVIDSTYCRAERIAEIILEEAKKYERAFVQNAVAASKMLVSPKRLIKEEDITERDRSELGGLVKAYEKEPYAIAVTVRAVKKEEDYTLLDGLEHVKAAYLAGVPFVPVKVEKP